MRTKGIYADPYLGWRDIVKGEIEIKIVEGNHSQFIESADFLQEFKAAFK